MFPFRVQNAKNNDAVAFDAIKKFVRKTAREQTAKVAVVKRTAFGINGQQVHCVSDFVQQFIPQTAALVFIPSFCLG